MKAVCWRLNEHQAVVYTEDRDVVERLLETKPFAGRTERSFSTYANGRGKVFAWQSSFAAAFWQRLMRHLRRLDVAVEDRTSRPVSAANTPAVTAGPGTDAGGKRSAAVAKPQPAAKAMRGTAARAKPAANPNGARRGGAAKNEPRRAARKPDGPRDPAWAAAQTSAAKPHAARPVPAPAAAAPGPVRAAAPPATRRPAPAGTKREPHTATAQPPVPAFKRGSAQLTLDMPAAEPGQEAPAAARPRRPKREA